MNLNNDANAEIIGKKTETHDQENFETVNISSFMKLCDFQVKIKEENIFKELQASKINEFTEQMQSLSKEIIFKRKKILGFLTVYKAQNGVVQSLCYQNRFLKYNQKRILLYSNYVSKHL